MKDKIARSHPHQCPVCSGKGELGANRAKGNATLIRMDGKRKVYECHSCFGSGIIWEFYEGPPTEQKTVIDRGWFIPPDSSINWCKS
jgi:hypothetical protein